MMLIVTACSCRLNSARSCSALAKGAPEDAPKRMRLIAPHARSNDEPPAIFAP
jgi:hypothetical protein